MVVIIFGKYQQDTNASRPIQVYRYNVTVNGESRIGDHLGLLTMSDSRQINLRVKKKWETFLYNIFEWFDQSSQV